jgi:hypothetical protein
MHSEEEMIDRILEYVDPDGSHDMYQVREKVRKFLRELDVWGGKP